MSNSTIYSKAFLQDLYDKGFSMRKISVLLECSVGKIHRLMTAYGIKPKTQKQWAQLGSFQWTENHKKQMSELLTGRFVSDETKHKISEARKGCFKIKTEFGGHKKKHARGYILVYCPSHPFATRDGYVFEHILAYEKYHNCIVDRKQFVIHHINGNKEDNSKENLLLMTNKEHMILHGKLRKEAKGKNKNAQ